MTLFAILLAFFTGFLSLSLELLWIRLFTYSYNSLPHAFSLTLVFFLIGIAFGALIGKRICSKSQNLWLVSGTVLIFASFLDLMSPWLYALSGDTNFKILIGGILIIMAALPKAIIFPIAHQLGTVNYKKIGISISLVYTANIIGATLGPIVTTFILLDHFTTQQCFTIIASVGLVVGLFCIGKSIPRVIWLAAFLYTLILSIIILPLNPTLLIAKLSSNPEKIRNIVESRQGIVTIYEGKNGDDIIFGGNIYDGRTNLDPINNSNHIERLLILAALQDKPTNVLMIGLSIGTWLKLITSFPHVKNIDVIEINPGYVKAMSAYPAQYSALQDSRVHLYIDDGRRWLRTHPNNHYDLIIMNTTFHWRAYATNLLSLDFLNIIKHHLNDHGFFAYNMTNSFDAFKTANSVYPFSFLYENFVIASDFDWRYKLKEPVSIRKIAQLKLDGKFIFPPQDAEKQIRSFLNVPLFSWGEIKDNKRFDIITDMNLLSEYKHAVYHS